MTTTISKNPYWNNLSSFNFDDLFSSLSNSIQFDDNCLSIKHEYEEIDQQQIQTSLTNNSPVVPHLTHMVCGVCGAPANGYNFDQITCESCKAFFRRNALRYMPDLQCRFTGSCVINMKTRRYCAYCRLKKCFDIKMRKDWIRTNEEKELRQLQKLTREQQKTNQLTNDQRFILNLPLVVRKKKRLIVKPTTQKLIIKPINTETIFCYNHNLSNDDRIILNNITNAYQLVVHQADAFRINKCTSSVSLIEFMNGESKMHESLISFYQHIPDFTQLYIEDQVLLIKCNLVNIVILHYILAQNFQESPMIGLYMSEWINADFHNQMSRARQHFDRFIEHPLILKVALVIFIFSINISTSRGINLFDNYTNKMNIHRIQEFYTAILWRYLNSLYGEKEAIRSMEIIMTQILHFQTLMDIIQGCLRRETNSNTLDQLLRSLFQLT